MFVDCCYLHNPIYVRRNICVQMCDTCDIRAALFFSKVWVMQVIWDILYLETAVQKDFSQKSMVSRENALKNGPKSQKKSILLHNKLKSQKVVESRPPLIFNFRGGFKFSNILKFLLISKIMHFWGSFFKGIFPWNHWLLWKILLHSSF